MRRTLLRLLCRLGVHAWHYSTITDIDPERVEVQECRRCHLRRGREWQPGKFGVRPGSSFRWLRYGGYWSPWDTFRPDPEPPFGALD